MRNANITRTHKDMVSNLTHPTKNQFFRAPATNETLLQAQKCGSLVHCP